MEYDNGLEYMDKVGFDGGYAPPPWSTGSFSWEIPTVWRAVGETKTNSFVIFTQTFSIDASGSVTIEKFGATINRGTNGVYDIKKTK